MKLNIKAKENIKRIISGGLVLGTLSLAGCTETTVIEDQEGIYDVIDSQGENIEIAPQVIEVPGEDFKLVIEYSLDPDSQKKWRITDNKKLYTKVYTEGLPEDVKVYIDNVHTDTTIVSTKESMNGILQDTMDDRIHNSLMYGFPIDDDTHFIAVNEIEGQNDNFISGSIYGFNGYVNGEIVERRHSEEEYLEEGVYANKIASAYGLLIQKGDEEPYGVDVSSDILVLAYNIVTKKDSEGAYKYYQYDKYGNYTTLTEQPKVKQKTN